MPSTDCPIDLQRVTRALQVELDRGASVNVAWPYVSSQPSFRADQSP
jgi:hypothetical protein